MSFTKSPAYTHLKSVFKGHLVLPADAGYRVSLARWSVLAERNAGVVAFVKDEDDVAAAVKFATAEKVEIAIKGESTFAGNADTRWWTQSFWSIFDRRRNGYRPLQVPQPGHC